MHVKTGRQKFKGGGNAEHMQAEGWRSEGNSLRAHHSIIFGASVKKCSFFHRPAFDPVASSGSEPPPIFFFFSAGCKHFHMFVEHVKEWTL